MMAIASAIFMPAIIGHNSFPTHGCWPRLVRRKWHRWCPAAQPPSATVVRLPPTVMLEIIGFLQTLEQMGGLGLTQKGELRAKISGQLSQGVQWPQEDLVVDGLIFKDAVTGLLNTLRHSDFWH